MNAVGLLRHARHSRARNRQLADGRPQEEGAAATPAPPAHGNLQAPLKIAIIGTVGIPAAYGGFETLVENLARFHNTSKLSSTLVVYCSAPNYPDRSSTYLGAELRYIPLSANGRSSVLYDALSLLSAIRRGVDVCLLLGVSGAIVLPLVRLVSKTRIVSNIDGIEWKREKWSGFSKWFLRMSERTAVRFSHEVIADNEAIAQHVAESYGRECQVIAYGGDHAVTASTKPYSGIPLPERYALALCRIEPENNVAMILEAFAHRPELPLVFVGNWRNSAFGRDLRERYREVAHLRLIDPIYETGILRTIRAGATLYVHGHSAGGTNPSLVEMMHFGIPIAAYDCVFNRFTTDSKAFFFDTADRLCSVLGDLSPVSAASTGLALKRLAQQRYVWSTISRDYFDVLLQTHSPVSTQPRVVRPQPLAEKS
jgi:glycosyltransferase involved in cell wall biosynthesis